MSRGNPTAALARRIVVLDAMRAGAVDAAAIAKRFGVEPSTVRADQRDLHDALFELSLPAYLDSIVKGRAA